jgi:hypothetical protein
MSDKLFVLVSTGNVVELEGDRASLAGKQKELAMSLGKSITLISREELDRRVARAAIQPIVAKAAFDPEVVQQAIAVLAASKRYARYNVVKQAQKVDARLTASQIEWLVATAVEVKSAQIDSAKLLAILNS